jgi:site-specific DNA-cytosine methylase
LYANQRNGTLEQGGLEHGRGASTYRATLIKVNAADYGSPQKRERVFIAGVRDDCGTLPEFPAQTHSELGLAFDKWVTGQYWDRHNLPRPDDAASRRTARAKTARPQVTTLAPEKTPCLIAVREQDANQPRVQQIVKAYQSDEVRSFILTRYKGAIILAF